jgi:transcription elongation factor GreA
MNEATNTSLSPTNTESLSPDYALTPEGLEALERDLTALREKRARVATGDVMREEQIMLDGRIASLEDVLDHAWVVHPASVERGVVAIGTTVALRDGTTGQTERYRVVGKYEPLRPGELSAASAIGRALLGRRAGESVDVDLPNGRVRRLEVLAADPHGVFD